MRAPSLSGLAAGTAFLLWAISTPAAEPAHQDRVYPDRSLNLTQTIDHTVEYYPKTQLDPVLRAEVAALRRRSKTFIAGSPQFVGQYTGDHVDDDIGRREVEATLEAPLWRPGQRQAGTQLAERAAIQAQQTGVALRLEVAGLVREALWAMALAELRLRLAGQQLTTSQKLAATVRRRVELGDLARLDLLLAENDVLERRTARVEAEAALQDTRRTYLSLVQMDRAPTEFAEARSAAEEISEQHPLLAAANSKVARSQAQLQWVQNSAKGQPLLGVGTRIERDVRANDDVGSIRFTVSVPFGGDSYHAPQIAASQVEISRAKAERDALWRELKRALHEAEHVLEVDHATLKLARERAALARDQLRLNRIAFDAGELKLIDLLKIQSTANAATVEAELRALLMQRDTARYNQAVGVTP